MNVSSPSLRAERERVQARLAEGSLIDFIRFGWPHMDPADFLPNWHIEAICEHLEAVARGDIRHLLMNIPPRHMKSLGVSVAFPAWTWAQQQTSPLTGAQVSFLFASYAHTLSIRDSVKCRRLIESPWYQRAWGDRFDLTSDQNTKIRFDNDRHGYRLATSVDGALTGEGADIIVVDDPHNVREAESDAVRDAVTAWWDEAMSTRLNNPKTGAYIVIMQRVHEKDLAGHILARNHGDWTHLCLPARYEPDHPFVYAGDPRSRPGELLWPARMGEAEVSRLERALGSHGAAGQLQQRPAPREGSLFKRHWFATVGAVPAHCERVRAWDLAATSPKAGRTPDWTCGVLLARDRAGVFYVEDVMRFQAGPMEVERAIKNCAATDGTDVAIRLPQDPGQAGKAQAESLIRMLAGYTVHARPVTGDKATRASPAAAQAEAENIKIVKADWNEAFLDELTVFPSSAHDDQVDALADAVNALALSDGVPDVVIDASAFHRANPWAIGE